eukprot:TRINITY_DN91313_c0_g1_i1.p1 TRINITY_DN91313_c0_g1~~TRINITY_DN91313_c0_g1_i1.p1  ORF type:complete len:693 (-),score=189.85 TRINITY_DN91313_c0_g1_i1:58-2136(-)
MHVPGLQLEPLPSLSLHPHPAQHASLAPHFQGIGCQFNHSDSSQLAGCNSTGGGLPSPAPLQACSQTRSSETISSEAQPSDSQVWSVTLEYENLLNLQRDQHQLAVRQMEAEVFRLRQAVQMLQAGRCDQGYVTSQLAMKEEEHRLALEAKQKELELLSSLLRVRDRQIGELQAACEKRASGEPSCGEPTAEVFKQAEALRKEKAELERLLVAKDLQINAIQAVRPDMADSSALQLGAQAIQMFHDSMRMKSESADLGKENQELHLELDNLHAKTEDLEATVIEKRGEIKELTATLTEKMQRVLDLETKVEEVRREKDQTVTSTSLQLQKLKDELASWQHDCKIAQQLVDDLKEELAERDQRFMKQQAESTKHEVNAKHLHQKVDEMDSQLVHAQEALAEMLRNNSYKDRIVREMTEQVNISETKLHSYQIDGLLGSRQRPSEASGILQQLRNADVSTQKPSPSRRILGSPIHEGISSRLSLGSANRASSPPAAALRPAGARGFRLDPATSASATGDLETSACSSCGALEASKVLIPQEPVATTSSPGRDAEKTGGDRWPLRRESYADESVPLSPAVSRGAGYASRALAPAMLLAQSYRPQPGDHIDLKVAEFTNQPENSACKALFCRLGEGNYLYGTQRVNLRLNSRTDSLEAFLNSTWVPLQEFVQQMQASQSVHLQKAQQMSGARASER